MSRSKGLKVKFWKLFALLRKVGNIKMRHKSNFKIGFDSTKEIFGTHQQLFPPICFYNMWNYVNCLVSTYFIASKFNILFHLSLLCCPHSKSQLSKLCRVVELIASNWQKNQESFLKVQNIIIRSKYYLTNHFNGAFGFHLCIFNRQGDSNRRPIDCGPNALSTTSTPHYIIWNKINCLFQLFGSVYPLIRVL